MKEISTIYNSQCYALCMVRFNLVPTFGSADSYDSYVGDFEKKLLKTIFSLIWF